jgi:hypothetical protein
LTEIQYEKQGHANHELKKIKKFAKTKETFMQQSFEESEFSKKKPELQKPAK